MQKSYLKSEGVMKTRSSATDCGSPIENPRLRGKQTPTSCLSLQALDAFVRSRDFSGGVRVEVIPPDALRGEAGSLKGRKDG